MMARPSSEAVYPSCNLGQPLLAFAGDAERPSIRAKANRVIVRDVLLLADPQSPSGMVGGGRWLAAKNVNERGPTQRLGEGQRVPDPLGTSYRCPELLERPIRVTHHPRDHHRPEL